MFEPENGRKILQQEIIFEATDNELITLLRKYTIDDGDARNF